MAGNSGFAPYHSSRQFATLRSYLGADETARRWAEEQFELDLELPPSAPPELEGRCNQALFAMEGLPLQVKDILRGTIDRLVLAPGREFAIDELGNWRDGVVRINCDWGSLAPLQTRAADPVLARQLLQTTFIHECGHALVEDPRGGVPLRNFMELVAASGWLPHPCVDPVPFRAGGLSPLELADHYLNRLRDIDPRWTPDRPVRSSEQPPPSHLDRDLMGIPETAAQPPLSKPRSLGLKGPRRLTRELFNAASAGTLPGDLAKVGLLTGDVRRVVQRRRPVSPYADHLISEAPAEIFRQLQRGDVGWVAAREAMSLGDRLLIQPWREAEIELGGREPAHRPQPSARHFTLVR